MSNDMMKTEEFMRGIAEILDESFKDTYGERMAFFLSICPFDDEEAVGNYVSNVPQEDAVMWLRKLADKLENRETIPAVDGPMQ